MITLTKPSKRIKYIKMWTKIKLRYIDTTWTLRNFFINNIRIRTGRRNRTG